MIDTLTALQDWFKHSEGHYSLILAGKTVEDDIEVCLEPLIFDKQWYLAFYRRKDLSLLSPKVVLKVGKQSSKQSEIDAIKNKTLMVTSNAETPQYLKDLHAQHEAQQTTGDVGHQQLMADIENIKAMVEHYEFHDFKNSDIFPAPKLGLISALEVMIERVKEGEYDN